MPCRHADRDHMTGRRKASAPPASGNASAAAPAALAVLRTWHCFAFLIATAILLYYAKWPILFIAGAVGLFRGLAGYVTASSERCGSSW
jgi:hypothetical protein